MDGGQLRHRAGVAQAAEQRGRGRDQLEDLRRWKSMLELDGGRTIILAFLSHWQLCLAVFRIGLNTTEYVASNGMKTNIIFFNMDQLIIH